MNAVTFSRVAGTLFVLIALVHLGHADFGGHRLLAARVLPLGNNEEGKDTAKRHGAHDADNGEGRLALPLGAGDLVA